MQGSIDFTGLLSGDIIGEGGTTVIANPSGSATDTLNKVQIDETIYSVEGGGGSEVIANPTGTPTEDINTIEISDVIYQIVGEEGPEGPQGPQGPKGPQGPAGEGVPTGGSSGQVLIKDSATNYDTSWTTLDASAIPYDNTTSGMTAVDVQDAVSELKSNLSQLDGLTVYKNLTPQTSYADFDDGSTLPLISLTSNIDPIQDLHGYDAPWAGGAGKNKLNLSTRASATVQGITSEVKADNTIVASGTSTGNGDIVCPVETPFTMANGETYTISLSGTDTRARQFTIFIGTSYRNVGVISAAEHSLTFTVTRELVCNQVMLRTSVGATVNINAKLQIEKGSTATSYAPYENECPISGHTEANVVVSPTTDAEDGTTHNIQFKDGDNPLTVYGGTLEVVSGVLTVTDEYIASYNGETLPATWISDRDVYAEGTTPTIGAEVVYELATPQTYQLSPTQVNSLLGQNYISSDTGNIANVKYLGIITFS